MSVFEASSWYAETIEGLRAEAVLRGVTLCRVSLHGLDTYAGPNPLIVLGSTQAFFDECLRLCHRYGIRPLIAGLEAGGMDHGVSCVTFGRKKAMEEVVHYLYGCGAREDCPTGLPYPYFHRHAAL